MKRLLILLAAAALFYSCSPMVTTSIATRYDSIPSDQTIAVYGLNDSVPGESQKLGTISIGDTGFSTNCTYENVIYLAKVEARKVGGNALKITDHREPNFWVSSCHRIAADILRLPDSFEKVTPTESDIENVDGRMIANSYYVQDNNAEEQKKYSKLKISAGIGGGYRINKLADGLSSRERGIMKKLKWGMNLELGGEYYTSRNIGIGIASSWFRSAAKVGTMVENGGAHDIKSRVHLFYVGPKVVFRGAEKKNGYFFSEFSFGYLGYYEVLKLSNLGLLMKYTGSSLGSMLGFGYDASLSKSLGLTFKLSMTTGALSKMTEILGDGQKGTIKLPKDKKNGLSRIDLTIGVRLQK